jgi:hypothetical protein
VAVTVLAVPGCTDEGPGPSLAPLPPTSSKSSSPSPSPTQAKPTGTAEQQILAQYHRFWTEIYVGVYSRPARDRKNFMSPVVTEPLLSELLRIAGEVDRKGLLGQGTPVPLAPAVSREGGFAVVSDCVDLTDVVTVDRTTGKVTHAGPDRRAIETYLGRGADGVWRVRALNDLKDSKC